MTRTTTYTFKGGDWVYQLTDPQVGGWVHSSACQWEVLPWSRRLQASSLACNTLLCATRQRCR